MRVRGFFVGRVSGCICGFAGELCLCLYIYRGVHLSISVGYACGSCLWVCAWVTFVRGYCLWVMLVRGSESRHVYRYVWAHVYRYVCRYVFG